MMSKHAMRYPNDPKPWRALLAAAVLAASPAAALESDRQQPLDLKAAGTTGSMGDGVTTFTGGVEIRQGSLHVTANEAEVVKRDGRVAVITLRGTPARLEQDIEAQGRVRAEANTITYQVAAGKVELSGTADVAHPQYRIAGDLLTYDLDRQHFEGTGTDVGDGRIRIRLEPEVAGALRGDDDAAEEPDPTPPAEGEDGAG